MSVFSRTYRSHAACVSTACSHTQLLPTPRQCSRSTPHTVSLAAQRAPAALFRCVGSQTMSESRSNVHRKPVPPHSVWSLCVYVYVCVCMCLNSYSAEEKVLSQFNQDPYFKECISYKVLYTNTQRSICAQCSTGSRTFPDLTHAYSAATYPRNTVQNRRKGLPIAISSNAHTVLRCEHTGWQGVDSATGHGAVQIAGSSDCWPVTPPVGSTQSCDITGSYVFLRVFLPMSACACMCVCVCVSQVGVQEEGMKLTELVSEAVTVLKPHLLVIGSQGLCKCDLRMETHTQCTITAKHSTRPTYAQ